MSSELTSILQNDDSGKSAGAMRTIGEVAKILDIPQYVIRFWESKFTEIKPYKNNGRRYYNKADIEILFTIKNMLYNEGYTIKGVQNYLSQIKGKQQLLELPTPRNNDELVTQLYDILDNLSRMRDKLKSAIK
jgi:DNA-binding transcriptional MerR regulator